MRVMTSKLGVLILGAIAIRVHDAYAVHLETAERALDRGDEALATRELQAAVAARPGSTLAQAIRARIDNLHLVSKDCETFLKFDASVKTAEDFCRSGPCDGVEHSHAFFGGRTLTVLGRVNGPTLCAKDGEIWSQTGASVHVQESDLKGNSLCSQDWKSQSRLKLEGVPGKASAADGFPSRSRPRAAGPAMADIPNCAD